MKKTYKAYKQPSGNDFKLLWEKATFVFDSNILLNLYRLQSTARNSLLNVLEKLNDRIWIPYHVGLEFYRNRLNTISKQEELVRKIKKPVKNISSSLAGEFSKLNIRERHFPIDIGSFYTELDKLSDKFLDNIEEIIKKQQGITDDDHIRDEIEHLFTGRVGIPPKNQDILNKLKNEGKDRCKNKIPPGFKDYEDKD
ncbi:hypothetical protein GF337_18975 [candidate division KSB1 bacterium]|nr:hypothetical protein [candidate division KSB1 bacterium]